MMFKTLVIGDTQIRHGLNLDWIHATASYIAKELPNEIVIIGDWFDLESLSSYSSAREREGRRLHRDINAGIEALSILSSAIEDVQEKVRRAKRRGAYRPALVFTMGNHEERLIRYISEHPELDGILPDLTRVIEDYGFVVYPFLKPYIGYNSVYYMHYLASPMSGRPIGGTMDNKLNKVSYSFVHGHQQQFQFAERQQAGGEVQFGICAGAFYEHDEGYKGAQGNTHSRGTVVLHHTHNGVDVEFLSCERLKLNYL